MSTAIGIPGLIPVGGAGGSTTLQDAYDASVQPQIVVTAGLGAVQIRDAAIPTGASLFAVQDFAGTSAFFDVTAALLNLGIHNTIVTAGPLPVFRVTTDTAGSTVFWPGDRTFTATPGGLMGLFGTYIFDYPSVSFAGLNLQATIQHNQAGFAFNHGLLFNHGNTYRNLLNTAVNYGPLQGFIDQPTIQVNRTTVGTITMSQIRSFLSQPSFGRTSSNGTLAVTSVAQFQAFGSVTTGATVASWIRMQLGPLTAMTGTVSALRHISMVDEPLITTVLTGLRSEVSAAGGGTRAFINHVGTAESNFGGPINLGAGATVDVTLSRAAANRLDLATGDSFRLVNGSLQFVGTGGQIASSVDGELQVTSTRLGFGIAPAGSNWAFAFSATARAITLAGDFTNCLNTTGGSHTINAALSNFFQWIVNAPSGALGSGSAAIGGAMLIQGNVAVGTDRYGLLVTSSPAGGTINRCARFLGAAGVQIDGAFVHTGTTLGLFSAPAVPQPTALGTLAGFTAGVGTPVNDDSTFTGGVGGTAYTLGDVVRALKEIGAVAT